jgi:hypothetical protein
VTQLEPVVAFFFFSFFSWDQWDDDEVGR